MQTTNRTKTNPFTAFGTPAKVFIDGIPTTNDCIALALDFIASKPRLIKSFAASRINGVVKLYIATTRNNPHRPFTVTKEGEVL